MKRVDAILNDPSFIKRIDAIEEGEADRVFCKHGMDHILSVARIAYELYMELYIDWLDNEWHHTDMVKDETINEMNDDIERNFWNKEYMKEIIYSTALLHDIGRCSKYEETMSHREAGPIIARPILERTGFTYGEIGNICEAIKLHGTVPKDEGSLARILYRADKLSRLCFRCPSKDECDWDAEKKNSTLKY